MLHILFLILKIIGFLILSIILLVLLLLLIVICSSIRYDAKGEYDHGNKKCSFSARVSWLFSLIRGQFSYENEILSWHFRLGWKKFQSEKEQIIAESIVPKNEVDADSIELKKEECIHSVKLEKEDHMEPAACFIKEKESESQTVTSFNTEKHNDSSKDIHSQHERKSKKKTSKTTIRDKFQSLYNKMKYTFSKIYDNMKVLIKKKDRFVAFLEYPVHQKAFKNVFSEMKRLCRRECPKKGNVSIRYGFSDPSITGYVLAGISMIWPMFGSFTDITPDFDERIFEAHGYVKGRVYLLPIVLFTVKLLIDKNVRITTKHIIKFIK